MTEQETEVWEARLERIWGLELPRNAPKCRIILGQPIWVISIGEEVDLTIWEPPNVETLLSCGDFEIWCRQDGQIRYGDVSETWKESEERLGQFIAQWMPFFRRGCWLLGCDVQATAHEKAEWARGFTREEIEGWNLKF